MVSPALQPSLRGSASIRCQNRTGCGDPLAGEHQFPVASRNRRSCLDWRRGDDFEPRPRAHWLACVHFTAGVSLHRVTPIQKGNLRSRYEAHLHRGRMLDRGGGLYRARSHSTVQYALRGRSCGNEGRRAGCGACGESCGRARELICGFAGGVETGRVPPMNFRILVQGRFVA